MPCDSNLGPTVGAGGAGFAQGQGELRVAALSLLDARPKAAT